MRTLVVDDELVSRKKMEKIMSTVGQCSGVDSGADAVSIFRYALDGEAPFDLVTLDVSMPEMDGMQVLLEIRNLEQKKGIAKDKRVKIIMVTSQADKDTVITCIQAGCDDYVVKPFDRGIMASKFESLGLAVPEGSREEMPARKLVMDTVEKFKEGEIVLPVLPQVVQEIQEAMSNVSLKAEDLARIIEKDGVISLKLISTVNSPALRAADKIQDVTTAILRLGLKASQEIVSAIASKGLFETKNKNLAELMKKLWLHSLACACCAKTATPYAKAATKTSRDLKEDKMFLMGLVHDIGCVLLLKSLGENRAFQSAPFDEHDLLVTLHEVHTTFGAALLDQWGFSKDFVKIAKLHEWGKFGSGTEEELLIVNLADHLTPQMGFGFFDMGAVDPGALDSAKLLKAGPHLLGEVCQKAGDRMKEALALFQ